MEGRDLRARRFAAGLTAKQIARAAGTSETNGAAYERGAKKLSAKITERLVAAIAAGKESPVHASRLVTVPGAAAGIRGHQGRVANQGSLPHRDRVHQQLR